MARDRTIHNDVVSDVASLQRVRRGEVLPGVERRRTWPAETRIAIVSEALEPGAVVSHVARRHDMNPSQLFGWLQPYRSGAKALRPQLAGGVPAFATAMLEVTPLASASSPPVPPVAGPCSIEISIGLATVRIQGAADAATLAMVLKALRALA